MPPAAMAAGGRRERSARPAIAAAAEVEERHRPRWAAQGRGHVDPPGAATAQVAQVEGGARGQMAEPYAVARIEAAQALLERRLPAAAQGDLDHRTQPIGRQRAR